MSKISASVICANPLNLFKDLHECSQNEINQFHFDVMDGIFVPRYGLYPEILTQIKKDFNIPVDVHMMTDAPENYVETFKKAGADIYTFHFEATKHPTRIIEKIIKNDMRPGIAINPATCTHSIKELIGLVDYVLIMMIDPGVLTSPVYDFTINKILEIKYMFEQKNIKDYVIQVDGGVKLGTISKLMCAGCNNLVCGSSTIFNKSSSISEQIKMVQKLIF
jgi:ribulose-phosphate 3-epimerase